MADLLEYFAVVLFEWLELSLLGKTNMQPGIELQNYWERPFLAQELLGAIGWVAWPTKEALRVRPASEKDSLKSVAANKQAWCLSSSPARSHRAASSPTVRKTTHVPTRRRNLLCLKQCLSK